MTFSQQIDLLEQRGFMADHFKTGTHMAYWLRDFQERYDTCRAEAREKGSPKNLQMETMGTFNAGLELVFFSFRYQYDPGLDTLHLKSVRARLGKIAKPYELPFSEALKHASDIHDTLSKALALQQQEHWYRPMIKDFERSRNPDNDYDPTQEEPRRLRQDEISGEPMRKFPSTEPLPAALKKYLKR